MAHAPNVLVIENAQVILPTSVLPNACVVCVDGVIEHVGSKPRRAPKQAVVIDAKNQLLSPGFVDIHVHGGGGFDFMDATLEAVAAICRAHRKHGTTTLFPTTTTGTKEDILSTIACCKEYQEQSTFGSLDGARIAGVHLYGPYFAPDKSGCHLSSECRSPDAAEYDDYFKTNMVSIATCAAELPNAAAFYKKAKRRNCLITCGHSNASWNEMHKAFQQGMRHVDHFWCAMSMVNTVRTRLGVPMQGSMLEFVLANQEMSTEVIADGCHLAPELLQFAYQMKGPSRLCLVTDCSRALDMPPGEYRFGSSTTGPVFHSDGKVGWASNGSLASSIRGMDFMVRHAYKCMKAPLHDVIRMASLTPAERAGIADDVGSIEVGKRADLLLLNSKLELKNVWIAGKQA